MVFREPVSLHVVLVKATHTVHFIVDAAGDVLNVLHMGSIENKRRKQHPPPRPDIIYRRQYQRYYEYSE